MASPAQSSKFQNFGGRQNQQLLVHSSLTKLFNIVPRESSLKVAQVRTGVDNFNNDAEEISRGTCPDDLSSSASLRSPLSSLRSLDDSLRCRVQPYLYSLYRLLLCSSMNFFSCFGRPFLSHDRSTIMRVTSKNTRICQRTLASLSSVSKDSTSTSILWINFSLVFADGILRKSIPAARSKSLHTLIFRGDVSNQLQIWQGMRSSQDRSHQR